MKSATVTPRGTGVRGCPLADADSAPARCCRLGRGGGGICAADSGDGLPDWPCCRTDRWLAGDADGLVYEAGVSPAESASLCASGAASASCSRQCALSSVAVGQRHGQAQRQHTSASAMASSTFPQCLNRLCVASLERLHRAALPRARDLEIRCPWSRHAHNLASYQHCGLESGRPSELVLPSLRNLGI